VTDVADVIGTGARFAPDPLSPGRERWWDGWHWTARVRDPDGGEGAEVEGLHWTPDLVTVARPADPAHEPEAPTLRSIFFAPLVLTQPLLARSVPAPEALPAPDTVDELRWMTETQPPSCTADPMVAAFGDDLRPSVPEASVPGSARRRIVMAVGAAAAAAFVAAAAAAGAGIFTSSEQRPQIEPALSYRDAGAGFALRYPDAWRILRRDRGSSIRFAIASPGAPTSETNTVSVVVGASRAALPPLHTPADQLTETLRQKLPGVRLDAAARTSVAHAPGFRFAFRDPDSSPATRIEQYVGQTATGYPLTVTVTVREPRTAPTETELDDFLASLRSGKLAAQT
jgi:hypothetical protein